MGLHVIGPHWFHRQPLRVRGDWSYKQITLLEKALTYWLPIGEQSGRGRGGGQMGEKGTYTIGCGRIPCTLGAPLRP